MLFVLDGTHVAARGIGLMAHFAALREIDHLGIVGLPLFSDSGGHGQWMRQMDLVVESNSAAVLPTRLVGQSSVAIVANKLVENFVDANQPRFGKRFVLLQQSMQGEIGMTSFFGRIVEGSNVVYELVRAAVIRVLEAGMTLDAKGVGDSG